MEIEEGQKSPAFDKVMQILQAYRADVQEFLRETGYLPKNVEPAAIGKLRKTGSRATSRARTISRSG